MIFKKQNSTARRSGAPAAPAFDTPARAASPLSRPETRRIVAELLG